MTDDWAESNPRADTTTTKRTTHFLDHSQQKKSRRASSSNNKTHYKHSMQKCRVVASIKNHHLSLLLIRVLCVLHPPTSSRQQTKINITDKTRQESQQKASCLFLLSSAKQNNNTQSWSYISRAAATKKLQNAVHLSRGQRAASNSISCSHRFLVYIKDIEIECIDR